MNKWGSQQTSNYDRDKLRENLATRLGDYNFVEWAFWYVVRTVGIAVVFYVAVRGEGFEDYPFFWPAEG